ncbi:hypothetical protein B0H66DRAFT_598031 [Apodospora peruviana]|uniref:Uncharacterized protein n=1 Tax=Apodospora peruviana TaxID=516989 RepID=A0AAE0ISI3_9PEZI|nr:hypothetical protein B0H66DRAFT_598031 [Apodospora peruviana]
MAPVLRWNVWIRSFVPTVPGLSGTLSVTIVIAGVFPGPYESSSTPTIALSARELPPGHGGNGSLQEDKLVAAGPRNLYACLDGYVNSRLLSVRRVKYLTLHHPETAQMDTSMSMSMAPSSTANAPASVATHTVLVGYKGYSFSPNQTTAKAGETIEFQFLPTNHSVVRAEYMFPCIPYESTGAGKEGFFSGFYATEDGNGVPKWRYTIANTNPIFFYSSVGNDCNKYGMVGGINVNNTLFEMQYNMALDSPSVGQPSAAHDHMTMTSSSTSFSTTHPSTTSQTSTPTAAAPVQSSSNGLGGGAIAGVVIGAVAGIALIAALFYWYGIIRARQQPPTTSPTVQTSYISPDAKSFDGQSAMFSSPPSGVPSPPLPQPQMGMSPPDQAGGSPLVDEDVIYVPVKRSTIASGNFDHLPAELYNPAIPGHHFNSEGVSWNHNFDPNSDASSITYQQRQQQTTTSVTPPINPNKASELPV